MFSASQGPEQKRWRAWGASSSSIFPYNAPVRRTNMTMREKYPAEHAALQHAKQRCNNPNDLNYDNYGGRGIKVCKKWDLFVNFFNDMGPKPTPEHTLERINND